MMKRRFPFTTQASHFGTSALMAALSLPIVVPLFHVPHSPVQAASILAAPATSEKFDSPVVLTQDVDNPLPNGPPLLQWQKNGTLYRAAHHISSWNKQTNTWQPISPDLTQDQSPALDGYGIDGITAISNTSDVWYVGTLVGQLAVSRGDDSWKYSQSALPERTIRCIATDPTHVDGSVAAIGFDGYGTATPGVSGHVFISHDTGATWVDISSNLPDAPVTALQYVKRHDGQVQLQVQMSNHTYLMDSQGHWSRANDRNGH